MTSVIASSPTVSLLALENSHIPILQEIISDPEVRKTWRTRGEYWSLYQLESRVSVGVLTSNVISISSTGRVVGLVEILDPDFVDCRAQLSVVIAQEFLGTGIAIEASLMFLEYIFGTYPFDKICLEVHADNSRLTPGLHRLLKHEGTFKRHINLQGKWIDIDVFALWRSDMQRLNRILRSGSRSTNNFVSQRAGL